MRKATKHNDYNQDKRDAVINAVNTFRQNGNTWAASYRYAAKAEDIPHGTVSGWHHQYRHGLGPWKATGRNDFDPFTDRDAHVGAEVETSPSSTKVSSLEGLAAELNEAKEGVKLVETELGHAKDEYNELLKKFKEAVESTPFED